MTRIVAGLAAALVLALPASALGQDIEIVTADPVEPIGSTPVEPDRPGGGSSGDAEEQGKPLRYFFGAWKTRVPGTSFETDHGDGTVTQTTSTGTGTTGVLKIRRNGTYVWKGEKGRWKKTGDAGYPIVLKHVKAVDGKDWRVGDDEEGGIFVWDGSTWYQGKR